MINESCKKCIWIKCELGFDFDSFPIVQIRVQILKIFKIVKKILGNIQYASLIYKIIYN